MENCHVLKSIYTHQQASDKSDKPNDAGEQRNEDNDDEDVDPHHKYVKPTDHIHTIIGGKVSIETKQERKLLAHACLNVANADNLIADPWLPPWSHHEISFSRKD
jgi:transaldolase